MEEAEQHLDGVVRSALGVLLPVSASAIPILQRAISETSDADVREILIGAFKLAGGHADGSRWEEGFPDEWLARPDKEVVDASLKAIIEGLHNAPDGDAEMEYAESLESFSRHRPALAFSGIY